MPADLLPSVCPACGGARLSADRFCAFCGVRFGPETCWARLAAAGIPLRSVWLYEIGLSQRATTAFAAAGCYVLADVFQLTDIERYQIRGLGPVSLQEFNDAVEHLHAQADDIRSACLARANTASDPDGRLFGDEFWTLLARANHNPHEIPTSRLEVSKSSRSLLAHARLTTIGGLAHLTNVEMLRLIKSPTAGCLDDIWEAGALLAAAFSRDADSGVQAATRTGSESISLPDRGRAAIAALFLLLEVLDEGPERHRDVLTLRFGLEGGKPMTLDEIGRQSGVTRERVRQIERKALDTLASKRRTFQPAFDQVDAIRQILGLTWQDQRLATAIVQLSTQSKWPAEGYVKLTAALFDDRIDTKSSVKDFESAVIAVLARRTPLALAELEREVRSLLDPRDLDRLPTFSAASRIAVLGPAIRRDDGWFELPAVGSTAP